MFLLFQLPLKKKKPPTQFKYHIILPRLELKCNKKTKKIQISLSLNYSLYQKQNSKWILKHKISQFANQQSFKEMMIKCIQQCLNLTFPPRQIFSISTETESFDSAMATGLSFYFCISQAKKANPTQLSLSKLLLLSLQSLSLSLKFRI